MIKLVKHLTFVLFCTLALMPAHGKAQVLAVLPDDGTGSSGVVLGVPAIGKFCDITSSNITEEGKMSSCMVSMIDQMYEKQTGKPDSYKYYKRGLQEYAAAYIAEAVKAKQETETYIDNVVDVIDFNISNNEKDARVNLIEMDKAIVRTINNLTKIYTARLTLDGYKNYGDYKFRSPESLQREEENNG